MEEEKGSPKDDGWIDPDPFTVASTFIAAAALALQFLQMRQGADAKHGRSHPNQAEILDHLEAQVSNTISKSDRLIRAVERSSRNSDTEFFEVPYRVAQASLNLDANHQNQFQEALAEQYLALANISRWINHVIRHDPELAGRLGDRLSSPLSDTAARLNRILEEGRSNREAVEESKLALSALRHAIEQELSKGN